MFHRRGAAADRTTSAVDSWGNVAFCLFKIRYKVRFVEVQVLMDLSIQSERLSIRDLG